MSLHGDGGERACVGAIHWRMCGLLCSFKGMYNIFHVKPSRVRSFIIKGVSRCYITGFESYGYSVWASYGLTNIVLDIMTMTESVGSE